MVGLIQKIFFDMVNKLGGQEAVDKVKKDAGVSADKTFQINAVYPDDEWQRIFASGLKVLNITREQADDTYADYFGNDVITRFPTWFQMSKTSYDFLLIQPVIHNCFATGVVNTEARKDINDKFHIEKFPNKIVTHYNSPNHHCGLYKSLAKWIINYYKDEAVIDEKKCKELGDNECEIHIHWTKLGGQLVAA